MYGDCGSDRGGAVEADRPAPLTWSVRPCTRRPLRAVLVGAFILVLSFAVQLLCGSPWWAALTVVLLGLSVAPCYARTAYEVSQEGATAAGLFGKHRRAWSEVRAWFPDAEGVLLSPLDRPSRLAYTRGLYLRFDNNRDEVLARVEAFIEQASRQPGAAGPEGGAN